MKRRETRKLSGALCEPRISYQIVCIGFYVKLGIIISVRHPKFPLKFTKEDVFTICLHERQEVILSNHPVYICIHFESKRAAKLATDNSKIKTTEMASGPMVHEEAVVNSEWAISNSVSIPRKLLTH